MARTRILLFALILSIMTVSVLSFVFLDTDFFIRKWHIPFDPPGFFDSRQLAWASESYAQGYDPLVENPVNPRGTRLNYPRIWHILFALGINESHTNILGIIVLLFFFVGIGIFWFSREFDNLTYYFLFIVILSPPVMLGVERSNIELVLFLILALALTVNYRSSISALFLFVFASILKLYPIFGLVYLLRENKKKFLVLFLAGSGIFLLYALLSFSDFMQIFKTTPKGVSSSFGKDIWWMALRHHRFYNLPIPDSTMHIFRYLSLLLAIISVVATFYFSMRRRDSALSDHMHYIDSFRAGAAIYIGCFLLINTADYRMVFLAFTVPQIVAWARDRNKQTSLVPRITLATMIFSLWSNIGIRFFGRTLIFPLEELCNWIVLSGLLFLFFSTLPDWLKTCLLRPFSLSSRPGNNSTA
jgi:hypothetical protein